MKSLWEFPLLILPLCLVGIADVLAYFSAPYPILIPIWLVASSIAAVQIAGVFAAYVRRRNHKSAAKETNP